MRSLIFNGSFFFVLPLLSPALLATCSHIFSLFCSVSYLSLLLFPLSPLKATSSPFPPPPHSVSSSDNSRPSPSPSPLLLLLLTKYPLSQIFLSLSSLSLSLLYSYLLFSLSPSSLSPIREGRPAFLSQGDSEHLELLLRYVKQFIRRREV